jgi:hypothetical protein
MLRMKLAYLLIAVLAVSAVVINGQEKSPKAKAEQKASQSEKPAPAPTIGINVVNQQASAQQENWPAEHPHSYFCRLLSAENLPNVGLFVVGFIGVIIAICTLKDIQKQTVNAGVAAEAAKLNAQAVINSERPWFLVSIQAVKEKPGTFSVQCFNAGRTPGTIESGECCVSKHPATFVPQEKSILTDPFILPQRNLIVTRDSFQIREIKPDSLISPEDHEGIEPKFLFVYGQIRYWGILGDKPGAPLHGTWWCYIYSGGGQFRRAGGGYPRHE